MATEVDLSHFQTDLDNSRSVTRVSLDAGADWQVTTSPDTVLTLVRTGRPGFFAPNVAVFVTDHSPEFDVREIIDDLDPRRLDMPELVAQEPFEVTIGEVGFLGRAVSFRDPAAGTLAQVHLVTKFARSDASDVVHLVGTCAGDRVSVDLPALKDVMDTVRIDVDG